ncbi:hypothetical protein RB195_006641 [Necator americanus]|uniref:Reverse transcriptase domain-containing protein n=1 Tax=Necator americanus TaxID=51031 RepID=A0ABR1BWA6_NECAM
MGLEQQSDVLGKWYYPAERTFDNGVNPFEEQRKRKMGTLKLQLDYVLARNIPQSDIPKSRAVWDVTFDSDHRPVFLSFKIRFHKRNREAPLQPKIDMAGLKGDECRTNQERTDQEEAQRCGFLHKVHPGRCKGNAPGSIAAEEVCICGNKIQEKRLRKKLRRQQQRDNEWTSRAMEFEKAWEDRNPRKAYALLKQYSRKMERCPPCPQHCQWAPSAPELEHVHRPKCAVNEEPPTESEVLVCIQKMKNGKSGGDDGISAEMLKYLPPSWIQTTRDEQAGFRPGRSTIDQVFIVRRAIEIWQRYSKPMQLAFLDFEAAFDSAH